jgi:hypothetical protein
LFLCRIEERNEGQKRSPEESIDVRRRSRRIEIKLSEWIWTPASPTAHVSIERLVRRYLFRRLLELGELFFEAQHESRKRELPDRFVL